MNLCGKRKNGTIDLFRDIPKEDEHEDKFMEWYMCRWNNDTFLGPIKIVYPGQKKYDFLDPVAYHYFKTFQCTGESNKFPIITGDGEKPKFAHFCLLPNGKIVIISDELL